ncbi:MAG: ParB N-terminal domain-containing protein, partial [Saccharofermentanales bacterium]
MSGADLRMCYMCRGEGKVSRGAGFAGKRLVRCNKCDGSGLIPRQGGDSATRSKREADSLRSTASGVKFGAVFMGRVEELEPHPDAERYPRDESDTGAIVCTMEEGILQPLAVMRKEEDQPGWWVIDGGGRLAAAKAAGLKEVPCLEVMGVSDTERFAFVANGMRRRVSTGTRVLTYVKLNWENIKAAEPLVSYEPGKGVRRETPRGMEEWQMAAIAKRLHVSKPDVSAAILLARCMDEGRLPEYNHARGRQEVGREAESEEEKAMLSETFYDVLRGATPIRRWAAGFKGRAATRDKQRPKTDYFGCA